MLQLIADGCSTSEVAAQPVHQRQDREEPPGVDLREARGPGPDPGGALSGPNRHHSAALNPARNPDEIGLVRATVSTNGASGLFSPIPAAVILCSAPQPGSARGNVNLTAGGQLQMDLFLVKTWLKARLDVDTERGATMVEYVLILALIAILVIGVVAALGHSGEQQVQPGLERHRRLIKPATRRRVAASANGRRVTRRPFRVPVRPRTSRPCESETRCVRTHDGRVGAHDASGRRRSSRRHWPRSSPDGESARCESSRAGGGCGRRWRRPCRGGAASSRAGGRAPARTRRPLGHTTMLIRYWSSTCSQPGFSDRILL